MLNFQNQGVPVFERVHQTLPFCCCILFWARFLLAPIQQMCVSVPGPLLEMPVYHFEKPLVFELYRGLPSWVTHVGIPWWCSNMVPTCDGRPQTLPCVKKYVKFSQIA